MQCDSNGNTSSLVAGSCNTPQISSDTEPHAVGGFDWFSGTSVFHNFDDVRRLMRWLTGKFCDCVGDLYWAESKSKFRGKSYRQIFTTPLGIEVAWDYDDCGKIDCRLEIKGSAFADLSPQDGALVVEHLVHSWQFKATRVDIRCDIEGMGALGILQNVSDAAQAGNYMSFQKTSEIKSKTRGGDLTGWTIYFGSLKSLRKVRWYHKGLERKLDRDWVRCEVQYRGEAADEVLRQIFKDVNRHRSGEPFPDISNFLSEIALKAVQFRYRDHEKTGHYCIDDLPYLDWYSSLLAHIPLVGVKFRYSRPKAPLLSRTVKWLRRQVWGRLAMVVEYQGVDWVMQEIREKLQNPNDDNLAVFSAWLSQPIFESV